MFPLLSVEHVGDGCHFGYLMCSLPVGASSLLFYGSLGEVSRLCTICTWAQQFVLCVCWGEEDTKCRCKWVGVRLRPLSQSVWLHETIYKGHDHTTSLDVAFLQYGTSVYVPGILFCGCTLDTSNLPERERERKHNI